MFDLNEALKQWRGSLEQSGTLGARDIEELEDHLREEMRSLQAVGLTEEESFLVAARRLGHCESLRQEFEKVQPLAVGVAKLRWMAIGILAYLVVRAAAYALSGILMAGVTFSGLASGWPYPIFTTIGNTGILLLLLWITYRMISSGKIQSLVPSRFARSAILGTLILVLALMQLSGFLSTMASLRFARADTRPWMSYLIVTSNMIVAVGIPALLAVWLLWSGKRQKVESA